MGLILTVLTVFSITTSSMADYKVYVTNNKYEADLLVWEANCKHEAFGVEEYWFRTKQKSQATCSIKFVKSKYQSNLVIYFVKNKSEARWNKRHQLRDKLFLLNVK